MYSPEIQHLDVHSIQKTYKPLVIRVHMNNFEEKHPLKNIYMKEKKSNKSRSKSKSMAKKRSPSSKLFTKAHFTTQQQTFCINSKNLKYKQNLNSGGSKDTLKSSLKNMNSNVNESVRFSQQSLEKREKNHRLSNLQQQRIKNIIQNVHNAYQSKSGSPREVLSELSKVIYGQQGGLFEDRSFEIIDQSSIHGEEDFYYLQYGKKQSVL